MTITAPVITIDEFITGEKIASICDLNTETDNDYINKIKQSDELILTIYSHTHNLSKKITEIVKTGKRLIIITHNSDGNIKDSNIRPEYDYQWRVINNIPFWYCQNNLIYDASITPLPIGLENKCIFTPDIKQHYMVCSRGKKEKKEIRLFICYNPETNKAERYPPLALFKNKSWATIQDGFNNINLYKSFFDTMNKCQFVLCPAGNGIDTHRLWESLYLGCIPIVKKYAFTEYFAAKLPLLIVNNWGDITLKFLINKYQEMDRMNYNWDILKISYWKNLILAKKKELANAIQSGDCKG
jgi:hypothetical protein